MPERYIERKDESIMRAIMVMLDSLNRHLLSPYGCDWTVIGLEEYV
jgi:hypothetical protein